MSAGNKEEVCFSRSENDTTAPLLTDTESDFHTTIAMEAKTAITVTETKKMTMTLTQSNAMSQIMKTTMSITEGQRQ